MHQGLRALFELPLDSKADPACAAEVLEQATRNALPPDNSAPYVPHTMPEGAEMSTAVAQG